jgi:hypothetical protein
MSQLTNDALSKKRADFVMADASVRGNSHDSPAGWKEFQVDSIRIAAKVNSFMFPLGGNSKSVKRILLSRSNPAQSLGDTDC